MTDLIPSLFVPVVLGGGRQTVGMARRLFWRYGMATHIFSDRLPLVYRLTPWIVCHALPQGLSNECCAMALYDFAVESLECDRQPMLLLCDDMPSHLSEQHLALLESCYLVCRESDLAAMLAPALYSPKGGTQI